MTCIFWALPEQTRSLANQPRQPGSKAR